MVIVQLAQWSTAVSKIHSGLRLGSQDRSNAQAPIRCITPKNEFSFVKANLIAHDC
jgi:hypothetical protein